MKAEQRWSRDSAWLTGRCAGGQGSVMEVRGVKADAGWARFSSDQRSLESRVVIWSQSSEAKHCLLRC